MCPLESAFELIGKPDVPGPFVFTCEHASNRVPIHLAPTDSDKELLAQHWGWDIGTATVVHELVAALGGQAILGGYSRLVIDLNRDPRSPDLFVTEAEGHAIDFNQGLDPDERQARRSQLFEPYHEAIEDALTTRQSLAGPPAMLLSIHSFTPVIQGKRRHLEVGVLFDHHDEFGETLATAIEGAGFDTRLNEPYTGKPPQGLIYSAGSHGASQDVPYLELEIRQDLLDTPDKAKAVAARLVDPLRTLAASRG